MNTITRLLLSCCVAVTVMDSYADMPSKPSVTMISRGQERTWLHDEFTASARFELRTGQVVVWEPVSETVPGPLVEFSGLLDDEATRVLGELLRKGRMHTLSLTGPGGLVEPTLKLGRAVRAKKITTVVETNRGCYSACALLFLAGDSRIVGNDSKNSSIVSAAVGFHAPYTLGSNGIVRHQQDAKTSRSCSYIKQMVPGSAAVDLCDYTLATKGMATFSLAEGKKLNIYTDSVSEILVRWADSVIENATSDEKHWLTCERFRLFLESNRWRTPFDPKKDLYPCSEKLERKAPTPQLRLAELAKVSQALGPSALPKEVYEAARQMVVEGILLGGPTSEDQHYIDCRRSADWMWLHGKMPEFMSKPPYASEFRIFSKTCLEHKSYMNSKGRYIDGIGQVDALQIGAALGQIARTQGAAWTLADPQTAK